ncbi:MAG TPA: sulfotransferase [Desulfosalsimonadaceae bacterium]|nr:sulfotransferase [Desulfosalsimonadaceae bacterium]
MATSVLLKNLLISYQTFFRLFWKTFVRSRHTQARLTAKRFFMMAGFFPLLFFVQTMHWIGFILDDILFRKYRSVEIREPVFIVGVPRSGTTFLHRVLANDNERFTTLTLWELILAPSITERKFWLGLGRLDQLIGAPFARLIKWLERRVFGSLDNIHQISLSDPEEDYFALVPIYACFILILPFPFPEELGYLAFFDDEASAADKERIMAFYKSCLKRHLYVRGTDKILFSKNVSFSPMIEALNKTFPDSRIIGTVRNPLAAIPSHISSMMAGAEIFDNDTRGYEFRDQMIAVQRYAYTHLKERLPVLPEDRQMIVRMEDLKDRLESVVRSIYDRLGYAMPPAFEAYIRNQDERQKKYQSGHKYDMSAYELTDTMIYEQFSDVFDEFGYEPPESEAASEKQASARADENPT